jgi:hypothetical protein
MTRRPIGLMRLCLGLVAACGCDVKVEVPTRAIVRCGSNADCPTELPVCNRSSSRCVIPGAEDSVAPDLLGEAEVSPARVTTGGSFTLSFAASEELGTNPIVTFAGGIALELSASEAGRSYVYTYVATGDEPETTAAIDIVMEDPVGNVGRASVVDAITFDFTPPTLVGTASAGLNDSEGVPRVEATVGSTVRVSFDASEELDATTSEMTDATQPGVRFALDTAASSGRRYVYSATLASGAVGGTHALAVHLVDLVGLTTDASVDFGTNQAVVVDTDPPAAPPGLDAMRIREPAGSRASGHVARASVTGSLGSGAVGEVVEVIAYADQAGGIELAHAGIDATGDFTIPLPSLDVDDVFLAARDDAGNVSPSARVLRGQWVATIGRTTAHEYESRAPFRNILWDATATPLSAGLESSEGTLATSASSRTWKELVHTPYLPSARSGPGVAFDSARGVLVLFGGNESGGCGEPLADKCGYTWEWDGAAWRLAATSGPTARSAHDMVYDAARGEVILFGGDSGPLVCDDGPDVKCYRTWAWDGQSWRVVADSGPEARSSAKMVYDSRRARVVLFGGHLASGCPSAACDETWEWDGDTWARVATTGPVGRGGHAVAYDPIRERVYMFGGRSSAGECESSGSDYCPLLWQWDGVAWSDVGESGSRPDPRTSHSMAFDESAGHTVVIGGTIGTGSCDGVTGEPQCRIPWTFDGTSWNAGSLELPTRRHSAGLVYAPMRGHIVMFGGWTGNGLTTCGGETATPMTCNDLWERRGTTWEQLQAPSGTTPSRRGYVATAADPATGLPVIMGGALSTVSIGGAEAWTLEPQAWGTLPSGPASRAQHAAALDSDNGLLVLFGGYLYQLGFPSPTVAWYGDTWTWDGTSWAQTSTTGPVARRGHQLVFVPDVGVLLYGGEAEADCGEGGGRMCSALWAWTPSLSWQPVDVSMPPARAFHTMVYDPDRDEVLIYGGSSAGGTTTPLFDTWILDPHTPSASLVSASGGPPGAYAGSAAFDAELGAVIYFGGTGASYADAYDETWAWDGAGWAALTVDESPPARVGAAVLSSTPPTLWGGLGGTAGIGAWEDRWQWQGGGNARPAQVARFSLADARLPPGTTLTSAQISWDVGGTASGTDGVELLVWDRGAFRDEWTGRATPANAAPAAAPTTIDAELADAAQLARLPVDSARWVSFAALTRTQNGSATSSIGADYVELRIEYVLH